MAGADEGLREMRVVPRASRTTLTGAVSRLCGVDGDLDLSIRASPPLGWLNGILDRSADAGSIEQHGIELAVILAAGSAAVIGSSWPILLGYRLCTITLPRCQ